MLAERRPTMTPTDGAQLVKALDAQAALLPYALAVFAVGQQVVRVGQAARLSRGPVERLEFDHQRHLLQPLDLLYGPSQSRVPRSRTRIVAS